ncbi:MAG: hypothetical protein AB1925_07205 [Actinomycetota bacterium]
MNDQAAQGMTTTATVASSEYPTMSSQEYAGAGLADGALAWSASPLGEPDGSGDDLGELPQHGSNAPLVAAMIGAALAMGSLGVVAFAYLHPAESAPVIVRPNAVSLPSAPAPLPAPPVAPVLSPAGAPAIAAPAAATPSPAVPATNVVMRKTPTNKPAAGPLPAAPVATPAPVAPAADPAVPPPPAPVVVVNVPLPALPPVVVKHPLPEPPVEPPAPEPEPEPAPEPAPVAPVDPVVEPILPTVSPLPPVELP